MLAILISKTIDHHDHSDYQDHHDNHDQAQNDHDEPRKTWMRVVRVLLQLLATMSPFRLLSPLNVGSYPSSWGQNNQIFKIE